MADFDSFLDGQQAVYDKFTAGMQTALTEGFLPDPYIAEKKGGYLVALRRAWILDEALADFPTEVTRLFGDDVFAYHPALWHTTLSEFGLAADFNPTSEERRQAHRLMQLLAAASKTDSGTPLCRYSEIVFNQTTIILKGRPNIAFFEIAQEVVAAGTKHNMALRMSWGGHVTLARFTGKSEPEKAQQLRLLCANYNLHRVPQIPLQMGTVMCVEHKARGTQVEFITR